MGTVCWAISTAAVGVSQHFRQLAFWRAVNGFGLAIVIPALQSFIADSYKDGSRGTGFGILSLVGAIGGIGGGILATVMAGQEFLGMPGWRFAFLMMASVSLIIGLLVYLFVDDPKKTSPMHLGTDMDSNKYNSNLNNNVFFQIQIMFFSKRRKDVLLLMSTLFKIDVSLLVSSK